MSCKYLVNGKWISEGELKQVLNNGLLDNLIANNTIALEGFPKDPNKIISVKENRFINTTKSIPAKILADILTKEVATRPGYPQNIAAALELNKAGTDFKIPLWSSPYADKFEALLTSLISNNVVKQKFPGHSYVLGSEEGFRLKQGKNTKELKKSGIIFTEKFDPEKGLQPMRHDPETGKILPAQIMIPFRFKDEKGNVLNIKDFTKEVDGRLVIDYTKLPEKALQLFGFRIPTQEQNSMAAVEIVGFTDSLSGDLILAPRDFTKQMGSDFDVDKLYTYMYNTYYKDGRIHTDFLSDKNKIDTKIKEVKEEIELIRAELKLSKEEDEVLNKFLKKEAAEDVEEISEEQLSNLLTNMSKRAKEDIVKDLNNALDELSVLKRSYVAANQNEIINIHQRVMTSNNPEVIRAIMSLDSAGEFKSWAEKINNIRTEKGKVPPIVSLLSDEYQKIKYINATAGKDGVGTFSLDSTFNATAQGKDLVFINLSDEAMDELFQFGITPSASEVMEANNPVTTFGDITSKGDMSNKYTLRSQQIIENAKKEGRKLSDEEKQSLKTKSVIIRSLQSGAVDNEKEQILDKLNINNGTFDAIRALAILGFEEDDIVSLITQDIIWEYLEEIANTQSSLTQFVPNIEDKILEKLTAKYDPKGTLADMEESRVKEIENYSAETLIDLLKTSNLTEGQSNFKNVEQLILLSKFRSLSEIGKDIKKLQGAINTESKGVPKSIIESFTKLKQINNIGTGSVFNAERLLGEYEVTPQGSTLIKPTTINGFASFYGTKTATDLFNKYFPYKEKGFETLVDEIVFLTHGETPISTTKQTEIRQEIFDNIRSYFYSSRDLGMFTEDPFSERKRLFIDSKATETTPENKSLAKILSLIQNNKWYRENGFLNKLQPNLNSNGDISRVTFEAATAENFDEKNIYIGFISLLDKNFPIGNFNGKEYTSRMLAQDLIMAAFLDGGQQGAKQYLKYIPTAYLKTTGFGNYLNRITFDFENTFGGNEMDGKYNPLQPSKFARQYLQNNPTSAKRITLADTQEKSDKLPDTFKLTKEAVKDNIVSVIIGGDTFQTQTKFLSIFDSKTPGKFALYEYNSSTQSYNRIPTLAGDYGFKQYNIYQDTPVSIITKQDPKTKATQQILPPANTAPPLNTSGPVVNNLKVTVPVRTDLRGAEKINDLLNKLEENKLVSVYNKNLITLLRSMPDLDKINVVYNDDYTAAGSYNSESNTVTLNFKLMNNLEFTENKKASTIIHELIHAYSSSVIKAYQKNDLSKLTKAQIKTVEKLKALQKEYIDSLVASGNKADLITFHNAYWTKKLENKKISKEDYDKIIARGPAGLGTDETTPLEFNTEALSKYYGAIKLEEFVTMALTDEGFQRLLNEVESGDPLPFWQQLVDLLIELIEGALDIKINKTSILPNAIEESLNLLKTNINNIVPAISTQPTIQPTEVKEEVQEPKYELFPGVYANQGQRTAIDLLTDFLDSDKTAFLLQGKGGTGKTTIIKKVVAEAQANGMSVLGIAPTHKAKKILGNSIKTIKTTTLAAALAIKLDESTGKFTPDEFARSRGRVPIKGAQLIVLDESSMISDKLLEEIKQMLPKGSKIIFMGDRAQLPPVGQESDSKVFDVQNGYELTEKMRQAATSPIINIGSKVAANVETTENRVANPIENSDRINQVDPISGSSVTWESNETKALDDFAQDIRDANGDLNFAKIVTFNNQNHNNPQSVKNLNKKIRERLFGDEAKEKQFIPGEILTAYDSFGGEQPEFYNSEDFTVANAEERKDSKFTATANSAAKGVRSVDITLDIVYLDLINEEGKTLRNIPVVAESSKALYENTLQKLFKTDPQLAYSLQNKFANLEYGYAITSHKAQGSTYTNVYVMEDNIMGPSNGGSIKAKNQSLYVAVSRPTTKLVMVSNKNSGQQAPAKSFNPMSFSPEEMENLRQANRPSFEDEQAYNNMMGYSDELIDPTILNPSEMEEFLLLCKK